MALHFRYAIVEAGNWRRYKDPVGEHGSVDEDRPHFIAKTELGDKFVALDASGMIGRTGLCPGWVRLPNGDEIRAYRFMHVGESPEGIEEMLGDLDNEVVSKERFF